MEFVYLNNQFVAQENARIPVMDRGFLFGDAIYEVIPFFNGRGFGMREHLERLMTSGTKSNIPIRPHSHWETVIDSLIKKNNMNDLDFSVYIQVSRGTYPTRSHAIPKQLETTEVAFCMPLRKVDLSQTHRAILREDTRHQHCHIKSTNLFANTQLQQIAQDNNAIECILHQGTRVTEGTSSNVFIVKRQKILTPSLEHNILRGITRDKIING